MTTSAAPQLPGNARALIIFAKNPVAGAVKTRLVPPLTIETAAELYACMLQDILAMMRSLTDITPFIFFQDDPGAADYFTATAADIMAIAQQGENLGERMESAFTEIFSQGFGKIAIIGSDSPDLPPEYVYSAFTLLDDEQADVVFGPAADGGYYLLAMKRIWSELFVDIPWSSDSVLAESLAKAAAFPLEVGMLPEWYDIDTDADLQRPALRHKNSTAIRTGEFLRSRLPAN